MKILIVDDIETNRKLLRAILEAEGHTVVDAADGVAALEVLEREKLDAVISDILMPRMDGFRLCQEIRQHERFNALPFIVFTSTYKSPGDKKLAELAGADKYVIKPAPAAVILEALAAVVVKDKRRAPPAAPPADEALLMQEYNAALVRKLEEKNLDLENRSQLAALAADVGVALTHASTLKDMLQRCVESLVRNLDAAFARIWTLNENENTLELQASAGMYTHIDGPHGRVPVGKFKIGLIAQERKPHLTNSVVGDPRVPEQEWAKREGLVAFAGYPLIIEDRLVGVVAMFARQELPTQTLATLAAVADSIALGIRRKRAEQQLLLQSAAVETAANGIVITDLKGTILWVNSAFTTLTGYSFEEAIGKTPRLLKSGKHDQAFYRNFWKTILSGKAWRGEFINRRKDGSVYYDEHTVTPVRSEGGAITHFIGIMHDITSRKQVAEELRASEERFRELAENVNEVFWMTDKALTQILYVSPAYEKTWGRSCQSLYEQPLSFAEAVHPEDRDHLLGMLAKQKTANERTSSTASCGLTVRCAGFAIAPSRSEISRAKFIASPAWRRTSPSANRPRLRCCGRSGWRASAPSPAVWRTTLTTRSRPS